MCDLFVKKSNIQLQSVVLKPVLSLPMSFMGNIVLNIKLESTNNIMM